MSITVAILNANDVTIIEQVDANYGLLLLQTPNQVRETDYSSSSSPCIERVCNEWVSEIGQVGHIVDPEGKESVDDAWFVLESEGHAVVD